MSIPEGWPTEQQTVPNAPVETTLVGPPAGPPVAPGPPPGEGPDDRLGMGMLVGLLALAAVAAIVAAVLLTRHHKHPAAVTTTVVVKTPAATTTPAAKAPTLRVPNLIGENEADASRSLKGEGLSVRVSTVRGTPPAGRVVGERPAPDSSTPAHSIVTLELSNGAARSSASVTAPPTTSTAPSATTTAPAQTVTQTTTAATTTASTPTATTSPATTSPPPQPATASVPEVTGDDVQTAAQTLSRAGLLVSIAYVPGSDPLGTVEVEKPAAGQTAPAGSHVTVNASSGPGQKPAETVPDVSGRTIPQAVTAMQQAGLRLIFVKKTVTDQKLAGKVVEQTPEPGSSAPKNAQVLVDMGAFK